MKFLGINRRSYIQIRGFHGTDPATIDREIAEIVRKVRRFAAAGEPATTKDWHRRRGTVMPDVSA